MSLTPMLPSARLRSAASPENAKREESRSGALRGRLEKRCPRITQVSRYQKSIQ
jgi:hypothetical protein